MLCFSKRRRAIAEERKLHNQLIQLLEDHISWQSDPKSQEAISYERSAYEVCRQCYLLLYKSKPCCFFRFEGVWEAIEYWSILSEMQIAVQRKVWSDTCNAFHKMVHFQKITQAEIRNSIVLLLREEFGEVNDYDTMAQSKKQMSKKIGES